MSSPIHTGSSGSPVADVKEFVAMIKQMSETKNHKRRERRQPKCISLKIQPLNDELLPDGDMFWTVTRDITTRGLGFIVPEPITHTYLKVGLGDGEPMVFVQVRHSSSIGSDYPLYLVGVEFFDEYFEQ